MKLNKVLIALGVYWPLRRIAFRFRRRSRPAADVFSAIFSSNQWGSSESVSGPGSTIEQTRVIVERLPAFLAPYRIESMLDIPCGDFNWMSHVDLAGIRYLGADIVEDLIRANSERYGATAREFRRLDLMKDVLPAVDLVFCRDCLVHLSHRDIRQSLRNIVRSGARYLLTTTFLETKKNHDIATGDFRPINLQQPPFNFPEPAAVLIEECTEGQGAHRDKALALWSIDDVPVS